jgi:hypothetical protein
MCSLNCVSCHVRLRATQYLILIHCGSAGWLAQRELSNCNNTAAAAETICKLNVSKLTIVVDITRPPCPVAPAIQVAAAGLVGDNAVARREIEKGRKRWNQR